MGVSPVEAWNTKDGRDARPTLLATVRNFTRTAEVFYSDEATQGPTLLMPGAWCPVPEIRARISGLDTNAG